jgi:hypothetical protein
LLKQMRASVKAKAVLGIARSVNLRFGCGRTGNSSGFAEGSPVLRLWLRRPSAQSKPESVAQVFKTIGIATCRNASSCLHAHSEIPIRCLSSPGGLSLVYARATAGRVVVVAILVRSFGRREFSGNLNPKSLND